MAFGSVVNVLQNFVQLGEAHMAMGLLTRNGVTHQAAENWLEAEDWESLEPVVPALESINAAVQAATPELVSVPAGYHIIGEEGTTDVVPAHWQYFTEFSMATTPVTYGQFLPLARACGLMLRQRPPQFRDPNHPFVNVTWNTACEFAAWLSLLTGKTYRLPTEFEWERAARGNPERIDELINDLSVPLFVNAIWDERFENAFVPGDFAQNGTGAEIYCLPSRVQNLLSALSPVSAYHVFATADGTLKDKNAVWKSLAPATVKSCPPNPLGLYDMSGNVFELTLTNVQVDGELRPIIRGGCYRMPKEWSLRASARIVYDPMAYASLTGFRLLSTEDDITVDTISPMVAVLAGSRIPGPQR